MFKKSEESEWTRFSRALGGSPASSREEEQPPADEAEEAVTLTQAQPVDQQDVYVPPSPPPPAQEPEPPEQTISTLAPAPPPDTAPVISATPVRTPGLDDGETIVGDGASVEGTVRSERSIRVRGDVQGEIESKQRVIVDESARVGARIIAEHVTVLGEVNGSIVCAGRLEIASSARVTGDVSASTLVIQEGAFFEGNLKMSTTRDSTPA